MHDLWTTSDQGKPSQNGKIGMRKERSRGVLVTPTRLLTTSFLSHGRKEGLSVIVSNSPQRGISAARVTPIAIPTRTDLWYRVQLAKAVLGHREYTRDTAVLLLAILDGAEIEDLT